MNAVIVDIQGEFAAALCDNGAVKKLPNDGYDIGQRIELPAAVREPNRRHSVTKLVRRMSAMAAVFALAACTAAGIAYAAPYGTVSLDANASIEYTINCFNYVIDVKALNEDGDAVLESMDESLLLNKKIDTAVSATLEQNGSEGTLDGETEVVISVGTRGEAHSEKLAEQLGSAAERNVEGTVHVIPVTMDDVEAAHENDMTAGREWMRGSETAPAEEETSDTAVPTGSTVQGGENGNTPDAADVENAAPVDPGAQQSGNAAVPANGTAPQDGQNTAPDSNTQPAAQSDSTVTVPAADTEPAAARPDTGTAPDNAAPADMPENGSDPTAGRMLPAQAGEAPAGQNNPAPMGENGQ